MAQICVLCVSKRTSPHKFATFPFPTQGTGVFGRLCSAVTGSPLFAGRHVDASSLCLSAEISICGAAMSLLITTDACVDSAVRIWSVENNRSFVLGVVEKEGKDHHPSFAAPVEIWTLILNRATHRCVFSHLFV